MTDKTKQDMCPPAPTEHPDPRMHLVLRDFISLFRDDPKITYPLRSRNANSSKTSVE
jgi:hypothetical protein